MTMRRALYCPPFVVLALVLLVIIVSFGAIFAFVFRNRSSGFSYFAPLEPLGNGDARALSLTESGVGFPNRVRHDFELPAGWKPVGMTEPLSMDLRTRVLAAISEGASGSKCWTPLWCERRKR